MILVATSGDVDSCWLEVPDPERQHADMPGGGIVKLSSTGRRQRGVYAVEFAVVLLGSLTLLIPLTELLRLSVFDQTLARATHQAARAAAVDPGNCDASVASAFQPRNGETLIGWLLDADDNGAVNVVRADGWPGQGSPLREVLVQVDAETNLLDGVDWTAGCGTAGALIRVRARVVVPPWFAGVLWPDGFRREHVSWARNQLG